MIKKGTIKNSPSWALVKAKLSHLDNTGLQKLVQALYAANKDNKVFLHTHFALGADLLAPYKDSITQWINPPDFRSRISVRNAKMAISDYKKATGGAYELADLMVFYCEETMDFLNGCGVEDEDFYDALVRMFRDALKHTMLLPKTEQKNLLSRLEQVRQWGQHIGWGVGDDFNHFWQDAGLKLGK